MDQVGIGRIVDEAPEDFLGAIGCFEPGPDHVNFSFEFQPFHRNDDQLALFNGAFRGQAGNKSDTKSSLDGADDGFRVAEFQKNIEVVVGNIMFGQLCGKNAPRA